MIVQIREIRIEFGGCVVLQPASLDHRDHLAHRHHHAAQRDEVFTELVRLLLEHPAVVLVVEEQRLEVLDAVVESLHRVEVPVHHHVEQPVGESADAVLLATHLVPAGGDLVHVEVIGQAHRDEHVVLDEQRDSVAVQSGALTRCGVCVDVNGVDGDEAVGWVHGRLHPFGVGQRIFYCPRVEVHLCGQLAERLVRGIHEVHPHQATRIAETVRNHLEGEIRL